MAGGNASADPSSLTVEQAAKLLGTSPQRIRQLVDEGAPAGAGGKPDGINLVHLAAWMNRRLKERDGD